MYQFKAREEARMLKYALTDMLDVDHIATNNGGGQRGIIGYPELGTVCW